MRTVSLTLGFLVALAANASASTGVLSGMTFVVDAGHGTRLPNGRPLNPGAVGSRGVQEMRVTLAVAEYLAALLRLDGARVVLTRSYAHPYRIATNRRKDNRARAALANSLAATAFISIHADASTDHRKHGFSVFWLRPNSAALAQNVRSALRPLGLGQAAFHRRKLAVTDEARVPAVLVEIGFITNPQQSRLLTSPPFERREAVALRHAVVETFAE